MIEVNEIPDDLRWVDDAIAYRVDFWRRDDNGAWDEPGLWHVSPLRITGAVHVEEVIEWARQNAGVETFAVYAEVQREPPGLIRLYGVDPTESTQGH